MHTLGAQSFDLSDSFCQFECHELGEDFGIDFPDFASAYGASHVWTPDGWEAVSANDLVFPVFSALALQLSLGRIREKDCYQPEPRGAVWM